MSNAIILEKELVIDLKKDWTIEVLNRKLPAGAP
jgi:hypothetical protein